MISQETAGRKELARHSRDRRIHNGQMNCTCGWKTQTEGNAKQDKSFRRHQIREVLAAVKKVEDPVGYLADAAVASVRMLHQKVWENWTELDGTPGSGWICNHCTPVGFTTELTLYPCQTIETLDRSAA